MALSRWFRAWSLLWLLLDSLKGRPEAEAFISLFLIFHNNNIMIILPCSWGFSWEAFCARFRDGNAFGPGLHNRHVKIRIADNFGFSRCHLRSCAAVALWPGGLLWANLRLWWLGLFSAVVVGAQDSNQGIAWV